MNNIRALYRLSKLCVLGKFIDLNDIANSYTKVSDNYSNLFLHEMHQYNEEMLDFLLKNWKANKEVNNKPVVLDLACGTGFNSKYVEERLSCESFKLVDISEGMLEQAKRVGKENWQYVEKDMLSYLKGCGDNSFDIVICAWAIKYQKPHKIIKEVRRVLKDNGYFAVIVNLKSTLPEIRKIYPTLIKNYCDDVNKIMLELPNPLSEKSFNKWFVGNKFKKVKSQCGNHKFVFKDTTELVSWVTATGALAGFDAMVNMNDDNVKITMERLLEKEKITSITHKFVWGVYKNVK